MRFSLKTFGRSGAALAMLASGQVALAAHEVIYDARSDAFASSAAHQGPNVAQSSSRIINGAVQPGSTFSGSGGSATGGGSVGQSWAETSQPGGNGGASFGNAAFSSANLATGILKATTASYGPSNFGTPLGFAEARIDDTIFFTNSTAGNLLASFTYRFDGRLFDPSNTANPGGVLGLSISCASFRCFNGIAGNNQGIVFAGTGTSPQVK